jgi:hypothetical protein
MPAAPIPDGPASAFARAFIAGDAAAMAGLLAPDATFRSPVMDYDGARRATTVLATVVRVVGERRATSVLGDGRETAAFFAAEVDGRDLEGVLHVVAAPGGAVARVTLLVRPLDVLHTAIERMRAALAGRRRAP